MNGYDYGLGPSRRVKRRKDYLRIQSEGRKIRSKHFLTTVAARIGSVSESADSRIGVTITKKIDKRAARRNRLRRRIREFFRLNRSRLRPSTDIVVIALAGATEPGMARGKAGGVHSAMVSSHS